MPLETVANLWTLTGHPRPSAEWPSSRKIATVAQAGFAAVTGGLDEAAITQARSTGLQPVGWFWALDAVSVREQVLFFSRLGVRHVTVPSVERRAHHVRLPGGRPGLGRIRTEPRFAAMGAGRHARPRPQTLLEKLIALKTYVTRTRP